MHLRAISLLSITSLIQAHMSLWYPGPLGGAKECNNVSTETDPELNFPLGCCDSEGQPTLSSPGVCRGHLDLFDKEESQVIWKPGQSAYFQLSEHTYTVGAPGTTHYGGSCQIGFSTDRGESWKVAASFNGNCPHRAVGGAPEAQTFHFNVPTGMPEGRALFGWIWLNREHESFMNCAAVQISPGGVSAKPKVATTNHPVAAQATDRSNTHNSVLSTNTKTYIVDTISPLSMGLHSSTTINQYASTKLEIDKSESGHHTDFMIDKGKYQSLCQSSIHSLTRSSKVQKGTSQAKRADMELHEREKRSTACDWDTAPSMAVSYYTIDAACMPNAKLRYHEPDTFEVGWAVPCGNIEGDGEYPIKMLDCHGY